MPKTRLIIKAISAALFAVVAVVGVHFALWYYAGHRAEVAVRGYLDNLKAQGMVYGAVRKTGYPLEVKLEIADVRLDWLEEPTGRQVRYMIGDLELATDFLGSLKTELKLPAAQQLEIFEGGFRRAAYDILMSGGVLAAYQGDNKDELTLNAQAISVWRQLPNDGKELTLKTAELFFTRRAPEAFGFSPNWEWRLLASKLQTDDNTPPLDSLLLELQAEKISENEFQNLLLAFLSDNPLQQNLELGKLVRRLSDAGAKVSLGNFRVASGPIWLTLRGNMSLDVRQRVNGSLSLNTNIIQVVMGTLSAKQMIEPGLVDGNSMLAKVFDKADGSVNLNLSANQGSLTFNGIPVGVMPPLPELLSIPQ